MDRYNPHESEFFEVLRTFFFYELRVVLKTKELNFNGCNLCAVRERCHLTMPRP